MILLALAAELADLATYRPSNEVNPFVLAAGAGAPLAKIALLVLILATVFLLRLPGDPRLRRLRGLRLAAANEVLVAAIVAGCVGALSNVL